MELANSDVRQVQLPTGETRRITNLGSSSILDSQAIKEVLYVPHFRYNLLSVSKITKKTVLFISFLSDCCVFQDIYSEKVKGIGRVDHSLYVLDLKIRMSLKEKMQLVRLLLH